MKQEILPKNVAEQVSELTTNRLSLYLRCLGTLDATGVETVSSRVLAKQVHLNAAQIRKDLAQFGEFGIRGVGYYVKNLRKQLRRILGLDKQVRIAIIGAGNLGSALAGYPGFLQEGFEISALFDIDSKKIGLRSSTGIRTHDIQELKKVASDKKIAIAIIAVPSASAQEVLDTIVLAGIRAILNFSPGNLLVPKFVKLKNVDLTVSLESLSFHLALGDEEDGSDGMRIN